MRHITDLLNAYIKGKDQDQFAILERIYHEQAKVLFKLNTKGISFPSEIKGAKQIAKVLSLEFNKNYDYVKTYYLTRGILDERENSLNTQKWLVIMREISTDNIKVGCGLYNWVFGYDKNQELKIRLHEITIDEMLNLTDLSFEDALNIQNNIDYPWPQEKQAVSELKKYSQLAEIVKSIESRS